MKNKRMAEGGEMRDGRYRWSKERAKDGVRDKKERKQEITLTALQDVSNRNFEEIKGHNNHKRQYSVLTGYGSHLTSCHETSCRI